MFTKALSLILTICVALLLTHVSNVRAEGSAPTIDSMEFSTQQASQGGQGFAARLVLIPGQIHTNTIETGDPSNLRIRLSDSGGSSVIEHIAIYFNLGKISREVIDSDTYLVYQKGEQLVVKDPHGFFENISAKTATLGRSLQLRLDFTFKEPMQKSDVIIRIWNEDRNSVDVRYQDALQVVRPKTVSPDSLVPVWFKDNAKWWATGQIDDSDFVAGVQHLIKYQIIKVPDTAISNSDQATQIPSWVKNTAGWWADDIISVNDFVSGLQWMISNRIIVV